MAGCVVSIDWTVLCDVRVRRSRQLVGLLTGVALLAIVVGVTGLDVSLPLQTRNTERAALPGVRALAASVLLRVGAGAPTGGQLAFLAVEPNGNLLISDSKRHTVMRFDPSGHLLSEWGPRLGDTILIEPAGVAVQNNSYYVLDRGMPRVFHLDASGSVLAVLSLESFGTYGLNGLSVDRAGNIYAADTGRNRILVLAADGALRRMVGRAGVDLGGFTQPMMLAFGPDGSFFVADWENSRIERWSAVFEATDAWSIGFHPFGVAVDQIGRVFVPDPEHRRVEAYSPQGVLLGDMGGAGSPPIDLAPKQVAIGGSDQPSLYVLASDGIVRLDLADTPAPPQGGSDVDVVSLVVIAVLVIVLGSAVLSRRARKRTALLAGATLGRPIRLHAENGTQRQHQKTSGNQDLLIADQPKRQQ
jgi:sugar lactone lactonase YvrE